jgi:hypothetical protein
VRPTDLIAVFAPRFDATGIEWMIAGGVASIVYGEPRLTQDLDVVAAISPVDAMSVAPAHKRLAELYDAKGDVAKAITHYRTYIEMWKGADPELQPWVTQARQRLAVLERARG